MPATAEEARSGCEHDWRDIGYRSILDRETGREKRVRMLMCAKCGQKGWKKDEVVDTFGIEVRAGALRDAAEEYGRRMSDAALEVSDAKRMASLFEAVRMTEKAMLEGGCVFGLAREKLEGARPALRPMGYEYCVDEVLTLLDEAERLDEMHPFREWSA